RDPFSVRRDFEYIHQHYGGHPALHRVASIHGGALLPEAAQLLHCLDMPRRTANRIAHLLEHETPSVVYGRLTSAQKALVDAISSSDDEEDHYEGAQPGRARARRGWVTTLDRVWVRVHALAWVIACVVMIYYTNFFRIVWEHPRANHGCLLIAFGLLGCNMLLLFYLGVYLESIKKINMSWDEYMPALIPVMAGIGLLTFAMFLVALLPVFGWWTILVQFTFFMAFVSVGNLLPGGVIGSILTFIIFIAAFFTSNYIPHEGYAHY
ncbi:hypothetical protein FOZ63_008609, partial [Perkinsus olseni]